MKHLIFSVALTSAILSAPATFAQDMKHDSAKPAMSMDMDKDKHTAHMQEKMKTMQEQMDKMRKTTNAKERQKLMQEHMQTMQANMEMMRGMGGAKMMGGGQKAGMGVGMMSGDPKQQQEMMGKRMDMMQMMMEQMMQHQQMMQPAPAK